MKLKSTLLALADGRYTLTVLSANVRDSFGAALDGDGDGQAGGDNMSHLFRLFGDVNGDAAVNGADFAVFRTAFGAAAADPGQCRQHQRTPRRG